MSIERHIENRAWAFEALDKLEAFLIDPDFEGDAPEETRLIERKRKELKDGKYRVVILGAFNVGKSALVNAFLGDEYLPMVLEECTTKITHVVKGEQMKALIHLTSPISEGELETLNKLVDGFGVSATVSVNEEMTDLDIAFSVNQGRDLVRTLRPLVTMSSDEDFPQLRSLRGKFDEIYIQLPTDLLEDDVALVDSPGVHSISETNTKIAEEIIPNSHLVICMLDSQNTGTEHNRDFIEKVIKYRHRKLLFVINKSDQLNPEEIDPKGRKGPAKDLVRSLQGVVEGPEIFFVSALYALTGSQLAHFQLTLQDLDGNQKIKIPWSLQSELMQSDEPTKGLSTYLLEKSNIAGLRDRLLSYLYTENREGAILESVCRFLDEKAWSYSRPLQVKLDMARDVPRLAELKSQHESITEEIQEHACRAEAILRDTKDMACGGAVDGREYPGYEGLLNSGVTDKTVREAVIDPARKWLYNDANFRKAKKGRFAPLAAEVNRLADEFLQDICGTLNAEVELVENAAQEKMGTLRDQLDIQVRDLIEAPKSRISDLRAGIFGSYLAHIIVLGAAGAAAGGIAFINGFGQFLEAQNAAQTSVLAGVGAGALLGIIIRAMTSKGSRRKKLMRQVEHQVRHSIIGVEKGGLFGQTPSIREQIRDILEKRRNEFEESVRAAFEAAADELRSRRDVITTEEEELQTRQEEIIANLEPKLQFLTELGQAAAETAETNAPREASFGA
jgi:GTPase SAR1 family protein